MPSDPIACSLLSLKLAACVAVLLGGTGSHTTAADIPRYSIEAMCELADAIVEGEHLGEGRFEVQRVYQLRRGPSISRTVEVPFIAKQPPQIATSGLKEPTGIATSHALLFLNRKADYWAPVGIATGGARGVIWIGEEECYWYVQWSNPGGLRLESRKQDGWGSRGVVFDEDPLDETSSSISINQRWRDNLEERNPILKSKELARYLTRSTSPARDFRFYARMARQQLASEPAHSSLAVVDAIKHSRSSDSLDDCVAAMGSLFPKLQARGYDRLLAYSVNAIVPLIGDEKRANQGLLLFYLSGCARPEPLEPLRRLAESSPDLTERVTRTIERIENDLSKPRSTPATAQEEQVIRAWKVYVPREHE